MFKTKKINSIQKVSFADYTTIIVAVIIVVIVAPLTVSSAFHITVDYSKILGIHFNSQSQFAAIIIVGTLTFDCCFIFRNCPYLIKLVSIVFRVQSFSLWFFLKMYQYYIIDYLSYYFVIDYFSQSFLSSSKSLAFLIVLECYYNYCPVFSFNFGCVIISDA